MMAALATVAGCWSSAFAGQFVVFPKASVLASPDGHFEVRSAEPHRAPSEFTGTFNTLWLIEAATGRSRKLCDYLGVAAVAWSSNDYLVVTEYVGKRTSRALVFSIAHLEEPVMLDQPALIGLVPSDRKATLRENDHVFVEGVRAEPNKLYLRVWGVGQHDPAGFRWQCEYMLQEEKISCTDDRTQR